MSTNTTTDLHPLPLADVNTITAARELLAREPQRWEEACPFPVLPECPDDEHEWLEDREVYRDDDGTLVFGRACVHCGRADEAYVSQDELPTETKPCST